MQKHSTKTTSKKTSPKQIRAKKDQVMLKHAKNIIENRGGWYDSETIAVIQKALDTNDPSLKERVERAWMYEQAIDIEPWKSPRHSNSVFQRLEKIELKEAARALTGDSRGAYFTGLYILLLEHLGALAFARRFNELDMAICDLRERLIKGDEYALKKGMVGLRKYTREALEESVNQNVADDIASLTKGLSNYANREVRKDLGGAA